MKRLTGLACILFIAIVLADNVYSGTIPNIDPFQKVYTETTKTHFSREGINSYSVSFNISSDFDEISEATLDIELSDDCGSIFDLLEFASIFLDGNPVVHRNEVDSWFDKDLIERHSFDVTDYLKDNELLMTIMWEEPLLCIGKGDFYYNKSSLEIKGEQIQNPIPGAVWLLGSGLIGLIGIRRKIKS